MEEGGDGWGMQLSWLDCRISEENIPFRRSRQRWEVNVRMELVKIMWTGVTCPGIGSNSGSI
jgi:hypothetical protein